MGRELPPVKPGSAGLSLTNSFASTVTKRKAQRNKVGFVSSSGPPSLYPKVEAGRCGWAGCCLPGSRLPPGCSRGTRWFPPRLPEGNQQLPRVWSHAPCLCRSLASSLADGRSKPQQLKNKKKKAEGGTKHHFWPEHRGEAGVVALGFGRLLGFGGRARFAQPTWGSNDG